MKLLTVFFGAVLVAGLTAGYAFYRPAGSQAADPIIEAQAAVVAARTATDAVAVAAQAVDAGVADLAAAGALFAQKCAACHGATGDGTVIAPALTAPDLMERLDEEALHATIAAGRAGTAMPAWDGTLTEAQIEQLVALIEVWSRPDADDVLADILPSPDAGAAIPATGMGLRQGAGGGPPAWAGQGMAAEGNCLLGQDQAANCGGGLRRGVGGPPEWAQAGQGRGNGYGRNRSGN